MKKSTIESMVGKKIVAIRLDKGVCGGLIIGLDDGLVYQTYDYDQACCSERYMTSDESDEDLVYYEGAAFLGFSFGDYTEGRPPEIEDEYNNFDDTRFVQVKTSKGVFTMCAHNRHNGCYEGISIECKVIA